MMLPKLKAFELNIRNAYSTLLRTTRRDSLKLVLAVSGGADSMALMVATNAVAQRLHLSIQVATIHHGLRVEADDDVAHVLKESEKLSLPAAELKISILEKTGIEESARRARYDALESHRKKLDADFVCTAHTASDQAETVLMKLSRGSSLSGAQGIHEQSTHLYRPMLFALREEVESYLNEKSIPWVDDPMNRDAQFFRVRVRNDALPALRRSAGFDVVHHLEHFARCAAEDEQHLNFESLNAFSRVRVDKLQLDAVGVRALPKAVQRRVLVMWLKENEIEVDALHLSQVKDALNSGSSVSVSNHQTVECSGALIRIVANS